MADHNGTSTSKKIVLHRGPIPGTDIGHHWFVGGDGERYGLAGWPHGVNKGWSYEVCDVTGATVDDSMFSHQEVRDWAASLSPSEDETAS